MSLQRSHVPRLRLLHSIRMSLFSWQLHRRHHQYGFRPQLQLCGLLLHRTVYPDLLRVCSSTHLVLPRRVLSRPLCPPPPPVPLLQLLVLPQMHMIASDPGHLRVLFRCSRRTYRTVPMQIAVQVVSAAAAGATLARRGKDRQATVAQQGRWPLRSSALDVLLATSSPCEGSLPWLAAKSRSLVEQRSEVATSATAATQETPIHCGPWLPTAVLQQTAPPPATSAS